MMGNQELIVFCAPPIEMTTRALTRFVLDLCRICGELFKLIRNHGFWQGMFLAVAALLSPQMFRGAVGAPGVAAMGWRPTLHTDVIAIMGFALSRQGRLHHSNIRVRQVDIRR
jgi:hypothetical protein